MQKKITHPMALRVIEELIEIIPLNKRGTYNGADATAFKKGELKFKGLVIKMNDGTWGVNVSVHSEGPLSGGYELADIYLDSDTGSRNRKPHLVPGKLWHNKWLMILTNFIKDYKETYMYKDYINAQKIYEEMDENPHERHYGC